MRLLKRIFGSGKPDIEKYLEDLYVMMHKSLSRIEIKEAIAQSKFEAQKEGTDNLPENFGDFIIAQANANNEKYLKILNNAIQGGANEDDIRQWWNLYDLERRMILWEDKIFRFAAFKTFKNSEGLSDENAISKIRKTFPLYGDPSDESNMQGIDRPLPNELHETINRITKGLDPQIVQEQLKKFSSMNAFLRNIIDKKKSSTYI